MYIAYNREGAICNALENTERKEDYFCPLCREKLIFRRGKKIQSHFSHTKTSKCQISTYKRESKEHLITKKMLYDHFRKIGDVQLEYIIKMSGSLQIADVYLANLNIALEYQRSIITYSELEKRNLGYKRAGIKVVWLIDIKKFVKEYKRNNNIVYIQYAPFVDNFLNYHKGCIFFHGFDIEKNELVFYQLWSHGLKTRTAVCKKISYPLKDINFPLKFPFFQDNLTTELNKSDVDYFINMQLKYNKSVKNKFLSELYNQRIAPTNIPKVIGKNIDEQILLLTPLLLWQLKMYSLVKEKATYKEVVTYMLKYIKLKESIYIDVKSKNIMLRKIIDWYYKLLIEHAL